MTILNIALLSVVLQQAEPLPNQIHRMLRAGDAYNAALVMESFGDPARIAALYFEVSNYLYWDVSDLPSFITFAKQGIGVSAANAAEARSTNPQLAANLQRSAGTLAYNLASYTWPGWNEPGVELTPAQVQDGFDAAQTALQLMTQGNGEPPAMFGVNWALGAHQLARGRHAEAMATFEKAQQIATASNQRGNALLARGFAGLTKVAGKSDVTQGEQELKAAKDALTAEGIQGAPALIIQLDNAYKVFVKP